MAIMAALAQAPIPKASTPDVASLLLPLMTKGIPFGPNPKGCSDFEILVARGTGEPGPFGVVVGDMLVQAITKEVPGARGYAVQYPASLNLAVSASSGVDDVINRLNSQHKECPNQKFALVGYSQGAGVMHGAFGPTGPNYPGGPAVRPKLDAEVIPSILALVMFGDPGFKGSIPSMMGGGGKFPEALFAKLRENCSKGDPVCDPQPAGFENHLEYVKESWQSESAEFIISAFKGRPLPKAPRVPEDLGMISKPKGTPTPKGPS